MDLSRALFIQKVYSLLTLSFLSSAVGAFMASGMDQSVGIGASLAGFLCLFIAYMTRKSYPINMVVLFAFTFLEGMAAGPLLGAISDAGQSHVIAQALMLTTITFGGLTAYVFWSKTDFSYMGGFLFCGLIAMVGVGFMGAIFGMSSGMSLVYSFIGVILFSGYVLYDTSMIINKYPPDEYVAGTISLFLDFLNLFWFILRLLMGRDD